MQRPQVFGLTRLVSWYYGPPAASWGFRLEWIEGPVGTRQGRYPIYSFLNLADLFTKPVPTAKIRDLNLKLLGYQRVDYRNIDKGFNKKKTME